jgi:hypothetical protein
LKKKIISILILIIFLTAIFLTAINTTAQICKNKANNNKDEWTGYLRIEGKDNTVWEGTITTGPITVTAKNHSTGLLEQHTIDFPSPLGALDAASKQAGFTYIVEYWPSYSSFLITDVNDDSEWWHYWVDYNIQMVCVGTYELDSEDNEILIGYYEDWYAHPLKISVDKTEIKKDEQITITVTDETDILIEGATVYINSDTETTGNDGTVTVTLTKTGTYSVYADSNDFIRSEKIDVKVKAKNKIKSLNILKTFPILEAFFKYF